MDMIKLTGASAGGCLSQGHLQVRVDADDEDGHDSHHASVQLPEVNFNARDEFNLKFFDNADDNCFSDPGSVESCCEATSSSSPPDRPVDDTESPDDWMDSLMQSIDRTEDYALHNKTKVGEDLGMERNNNNNDCDERDHGATNRCTGAADRRTEHFNNNVIKIGM